MSKHCSVVCDTPAGLRHCQLTLDDGATIADALAAARNMLGEELLEWDRAAVGIYGRICTHEHVPVSEDRIELYRALPADPREARRARVKRGARGGLRRGPGT